MTCTRFLFEKTRVLLVSLLPTAVLVGVRVGLWQAGVISSAPSSFAALFVTVSTFVAAQLMAGVLSDYKESERIPATLESSMSSLLAAGLVAASKVDESPAEFVELVSTLLDTLVDYLDGALTFDVCSVVIVDVEVAMCRLVLDWKGEIRTILPVTLALKFAVGRIETISLTSFVPATYMLLDVTTLAVIFAAGAADFGGPVVSIAAFTFFSWLFIYLSLLLRNMDSPFNFPTRYHRQCLEAGALIPLSLWASHNSIDVSLLTVGFARALAARKHAVAEGKLAAAAAARANSTVARRKLNNWEGSSRTFGSSRRAASTSLGAISEPSASVHPA